MEGNKKRSAKRTHDTVKGQMPFMTTEELVARHLAKSKDTGSGDNEKGKEDFDNLLFMMSEPDSD